jgi:hypothetical protein
MSAIVDREWRKFVDGNTNEPKVRTLNSNGVLGSIQYDYIAVTYPTSSSETFTFKSGGSGGTTVRVVTVTYTDSTKESLLSVERIS